jgi:phosphatidyl-myo-inositol alpha-mannosyltransferase
MRVGLVCPYSLDVPGGVQNHVRDLAEALLGRGHHVSMLAPSEQEDGLPAYVVPVGRAVAVPFNGSVARMSFGPVVAAKVRRWLKEGGFDVVHVHEPTIPSVSLLALWAADGPVVATYHSSHPRSRALLLTASILRPSLEKISAAIAVSEHARDTRVHHIGGEPVVIPNGLYVDRYAQAGVRPEWRGDPTLVFVGRFEEPRKGFALALEAWPGILEVYPKARLLVVGGGDLEAARQRMPPEVQDSVRFLGQVGDEEKAAALRSADLYLAPHTGGESFGIVLAEAMAAGTAVLASDLPAFRRVLGDGAYGSCFSSGDADDLQAKAVELLHEPGRRESLVVAARRAVRRYDWSTVGREVEQVYETVLGDPAGETH